MFDFSKKLKAADLEMLQKLHEMYSRSKDEFNKQLGPGESPVQLEPVNQKGGAGRFLVRANEKVLSVRAVAGAVDVFLLPAAELKTVPDSELASRVKYSLQCNGSTGEWLLNGVPVDEESLRMLVLATVDALSQGETVAARLKHLRIEETSLTSAVKNLFQERYRLSAALIGQQEAILSNVARDLHDGIIGEIMILVRSLAGGEKKTNEELISSLELVVQRLRDVCADLSSREIRDWGLDEAIKQLCLRHSRESLPVNADIRKALPLLPYEVSLQIYRVIQESVTNALKHADCSRVNVSIRVVEPQLIVTIEDDGIGIHRGARKKTARSGGSGLSILRERVELIRGHGVACSLVISDLQGKGSRIQLAMDLRVGSGK